MLCSRPVPVLKEAPEYLEIPELSEPERQRCVAIGAGGAVAPGRFHALPDSVKETLGKPLFALLTGIWLRQSQESPRAQVDLLRMLGERATRELGVDLVQLRALATRSVARELGPVPAAEVLTGINVHPLLATGIVIERAGGLAFGLPAIAQWLAAQALLLDEVDVAALLRAPEDLELWRYPVALATCPG